MKIRKPGFNASKQSSEARVWRERASGSPGNRCHCWEAGTIIPQFWICSLLRDDLHHLQQVCLLAFCPVQVYCQRERKMGTMTSFSQHPLVHFIYGRHSTRWPRDILGEHLSREHEAQNKEWKLFNRGKSQRNYLCL